MFSCVRVYVIKFYLLSQFNVRITVMITLNKRSMKKTFSRKKEN